MQYSQRGRIPDRIARVFCFVCAVLLIAVIVAVFVFIGSKAFRVFSEGANPRTFFTLDNWAPYDINNPDAAQVYGASGLILGSIVLTIGSIIIVTPLALFTAVFFTEMAPRWLVRFLQPLIEIFTGVPSIVMGFLALTVLVPLLDGLAKAWHIGGAFAGHGWAAAILVLVVMVLPTVLSVSIDSLRAVPESVREASLALGSTRWQMMSKAVIPAAATGLGTAVVLGMGRAIGETLAVALVLGGSIGGPTLPQKLFSLSAFFQPNVNITSVIAQNFGDAVGAANDAYWTLAFVLLVISFIFICISRYLASRSVYK